MFDRMRYDIGAIRARDPAARSGFEVFFLYSGFHALVAHRVAHKFYKWRRFFLARLISQVSRFFTGIEIHPGAQIGRGLFIDHGAGVVIGETTEIGDDVTIYQGSTLGGTGKESGKRHPTIGDRVMIGSGARVLGPFRVGNDVKIAAGAVVLNEVPDGSTCVGVPARIVRTAGGQKLDQVDQIHIPDPVSQELCKLLLRIERLEAQLADISMEKLTDEEREGFGI
ncbi:serine acetyltransferase [Clostridia bacterium]|nr:serine acetyltransferase [Clostridia bacterium]